MSLTRPLRPARACPPGAWSTNYDVLNEPLILAGGAICVDLEAQTVRVGDRTFSFEVRADWKKQLLNGWDDVDLTRSYASQITAFVESDKTLRPWALPHKT